MERQVRLRNSIFLSIFLLMVACQKSKPSASFKEYTSIKLSSSEDFTLVNGIKFLNGRPFSGEIFTLFPGTKDTSVIKYFLEGKEHGTWKKFYPNGRITEQRLFENGLKVGKYVAWWSNGKKQLEYQFKDGEYEGTCREWNEKGLLLKQMNYVKGHEVGAQKWWYENGKIRANYVIINGRRFGLLGTKNCVNVSDTVF